MIEINNLSKKPIGLSLNRRIFSTVAKKVLSGENRERENLSLAFVSKEEIKKLNNKYRRKNKATDVLSFELKNNKFSAGDLEKQEYLGEIIICPEIVRENAGKYNIPAKKEMLKVFIHGILHLCGYDHEKSKKEEELMDKMQEKYLSKFK